MMESKKLLVAIPMLLMVGCANLQEQIDVINSEIASIEQSQRVSESSSDDLRRLVQAARTTAVRALDESVQNTIRNDVASERIDEIAEHSHPAPVAVVEPAVRARDEEGRFVGDDPETQDVNEAFVEEDEIF